ncbi:heme ABC exporter ATP-binding protein CcmA [Pelagibacterium sp. H642]|uniref:heme ABC exporter ATP-binding protein CcmA n=1 Tax=Pelagibacterium sp. H642 TaxID=1881069 RepID=UPI0028168E4D|nr:heme ABC exporter ATP-binding protein CcmA [Pelagibacterium sp. H642]WMT92297.1 heme ABC exporter ATP-binding protein CcmA [Pelagibacterium sp. H642]
MPDTGLSVHALSIVRGGRLILSDLSFNISSGEALLLRGPNGAGKSSALMALAGLLAPETGTIAYLGRDPEASPLAHLHYVAHAPAIKSGLSVAENLKFWADTLGGGDADIGAALEVAGLGGLGSLDAGLLSAGQTRRLALARLVAVPRPLWLLDEPTSALDTAGAAWVGELVSRHIGNGGLAVIATHLDIALTGRVGSLVLGSGVQ